MIQNYLEEVLHSVFEPTNTQILEKFSGDHTHLQAKYLPAIAYDLTTTD